MQQSLVQQSNAINEIKRHSVFDNHLEALRGLAALIVVFTHLLDNNYSIDPGFKIGGIYAYTPPGQLSVLVFFMLSGYVIALSNSKPIVTNYGRFIYVKKRLLRLYPIYVVSIVVSIIFAAIEPRFFSFKTIAIHLVFGQVLFTQVLYNNHPLWSLSYEIVYYALFLFLSAYKWRPGVAAVLCVVAGIVCRLVPGLPPVIVSYCFGACFWFLGVVLTTRNRLNSPLKFGTLLAFIMLMFSYERMNLGASILERIGLNYTAQAVPDWLERAISFTDFSYLLFCVPLLLRFTNRTIYGLIWIERMAFVIPGLYLLVYIVSGKIYETKLLNTLVFAVCFYFVAIIIYLTQEKWNSIGNYILDKLSPLGGISYGIYVIHAPIIILFHGFNFFSGSIFTFVLRSILCSMLILLSGWFLEKKFQSWIKVLIN